MSWHPVVKKIYFTLSALMFFSLLPLVSLAQPDDSGPKDGCDPYDGCPLDTWVVVLMIAAMIFAIVQLNKRQARGVEKL